MSEPFRVKHYNTPDEMGDGVNTQAAEGYHLSSWQIDPAGGLTRNFAYGRFVCTFAFIGATQKPGGMKCR